MEDAGVSDEIDKGILDFASFIKEKARLKAAEFKGSGGSGAGVYL